MHLHVCIRRYVQRNILNGVPSLDDTSKGERQRRPAQNRKVDQASRHIVLYINLHQCSYMYVYADRCRYIDIYHVPSLDDTSEREHQRRPAQNRKVDKASRYIVLYINIHQCSYVYVYADICRYIDIYHVPSLDDTSEGECQRRPAQNRRVEHLAVVSKRINIHQCSYKYVYVGTCRETD